MFWAKGEQLVCGPSFLRLCAIGFNLSRWAVPICGWKLKVTFCVMQFIMVSTIHVLSPVESCRAKKKTVWSYTVWSFWTYVLVIERLHPSSGYKDLLLSCSLSELWHALSWSWASRVIRFLTSVWHTVANFEEKLTSAMRINWEFVIYGDLVFVEIPSYQAWRSLFMWSRNWKLSIVCMCGC